MIKTILLFFLSLSFFTLSAQVRTKSPLVAEVKSDAQAASEERSVAVFPNPSTGIVTISLEGFEGKKTDMRIMNVIGNVVYREVLTEPTNRFSKSFDLNKLTKGIYYVKLETATYTEVRRLILR